MARIKYYNPETGKWEYADSQYNVGSGGNVDLTDEEYAELMALLGEE